MSPPTADCGAVALTTTISWCLSLHLCVKLSNPIKTTNHFLLYMYSSTLVHSRGSTFRFRHLLAEKIICLWPSTHSDSLMCSFVSTIQRQYYNWYVFTVPFQWRSFFDDLMWINRFGNSDALFEGKVSSGKEGKGLTSHPFILRAMRTKTDPVSLGGSCTPLPFTEIDVCNSCLSHQLPFQTHLCGVNFLEYSDFLHRG